MLIAEACLLIWFRYANPDIDPANIVHLRVPDSYFISWDDFRRLRDQLIHFMQVNTLDDPALDVADLGVAAHERREQRGVAAVCIEDKLFPKANSFIEGRRQPLAGGSMLLRNPRPAWCQNRRRRPEQYHVEYELRVAKKVDYDTRNRTPDSQPPAS